MQYSKFVNNSAIVRDEKSVAQSVCFKDISEKYDNPNVTLYLLASLILPMAVAVPSMVTIIKYYPEIKRSFENPSTRSSMIGAAVTGIYTTLYIFCIDIAAVYMYDKQKHEYGEILKENEPKSLKWSFVTLVVELIVSVVSVIITGVYLCYQYHYHFYKDNNIRSFKRISFFLVPIIFVSAHLDYIFAAWLTEPAKTTSVAIMSLVIILFLYITSRTTYSFVKSGHYFSTHERFLKYKEEIVIGITLFSSLFAVGLISIHVAAFFILPIPSVSLADYLENIVQISLVMIASLITYKIFSFHESDSSKILKQLTRTNELLTKLNMPSLSPSLEVEASQSESLKAFLKFNSEHISNNIQIHRSYGNTKTAIITLEEAELFVCLPDREEQQKEIKVLTSHVKLHTPPFWGWKTEVHTQLDNAMLELELEGSRSPSLKISLKGGALTVCKKTHPISYTEYPTSKVDLCLVFTKDTSTVTFVKSVIMCNYDDVTENAVSFQFPCNFIKASMTDYHNENSIRFDNYVTITRTPKAPQATAAPPDSAATRDTVPMDSVAPPDSTPMPTRDTVLMDSAAPPDSTPMPTRDTVPMDSADPPDSTPMPTRDTVPMDSVTPPDSAAPPDSTPMPTRDTLPMDSADPPDSAAPPDSTATQDVSIPIDPPDPPDSATPPDPAATRDNSVPMAAATQAPTTPQESTFVTRNYVLMDTTSVHLKPTELAIGKQIIEYSQPDTLKLQLHNATFLCQIPIADGKSFTLKYSDENNTIIITNNNVQIEISTDCLPAMEFILKKKTWKEYTISATKTSPTENDSKIISEQKFKTVSIEKVNNTNDVILHFNSKNEAPETTLSNNKDFKICIKGIKDSYLQFTLKESIETNLESNTWHINDKKIKIKCPCPCKDLFLKLKPKLIKLCDTSFLHFLNGR